MAHPIEVRVKRTDGRKVSHITIPLGEEGFPVVHHFVGDRGDKRPERHEFTDPAEFLDHVKEVTGAGAEMAGDGEDEFVRDEKGRFT